MSSGRKVPAQRSRRRGYAAAGSPDVIEDVGMRAKHLHLDDDLGGDGQSPVEELDDFILGGSTGDPRPLGKIRFC